MQILASHVALLVPSVRKAADYLSQFDFQIGHEAEWEGEGTKEIYVEREKANSLLLMEPVKPGAYRSAMEKRGPGFHHFAIDVLDLDLYIESVTGSGWLLHPISIKTIKKNKTAYLSRPGFPALVEVQQKTELIEKPLFVDHVSFPLEASLSHLARFIGLEKIIRNSFERTLSLNGQTIDIGELY